MKLEIVRCLGHWSPFLESISGTVVEHLTKGLKEKEALQKAHLSAVLQVRHGCIACMTWLHCMHVLLELFEHSRVPQSLMPAVMCRSCTAVMMCAPLQMAWWHP